MMIRRWLTRSLTHKLMALFFAVFFGAVCGLTFFAYTSSRNAMYQEFKIRGETLAKTIASQARTHYREQDIEGLTTLLHSLGEGEDVVAILAYRPSKDVWLEFSGIQLTTEDLILPDLGDVWQRDVALRKGYRISEFGRLIVDVPNQGERDNLLAASSIGSVRILLDRDALEQRLSKLVSQTVGASMFTLLLGGGLFIILLRQSLQVIAPLTEATKKVAEGDLYATVPVSSADELGELAKCFNSMTEQLLHTTVSKNYVDNVIRSMTDLLIVFSPDGTIRSVNHATLNLLGYEEQELLGQGGAILFPPHDNPLDGETYQNMLRQGSIHQMAITCLAKNGRTFSLSWSAAVMRGEDGLIEGIACIAKDRTEQDQEEEQIRLQGTALESAANAVMIMDRIGRITWVNPSFTSLTGYTADDVLGRNIRSLTAEQQAQPFYQNQWQTIMRGKVWHGESTNRRKDGSLYTEEETITPVRDRKGEISHFISIRQDVTKRKQAVETIQDAHQKLKALDQLRSQFFADISHELRTPLTVIRGEAEVTLRGKEKPISEYRATLERIVQLSSQMNKLVGDILFLARSESGTLQMDLKPTLLGPMLEEVRRETAILARSQNIAVTLQGVSREATVQGDPERLMQLFMILTDNAVKYGRKDGSIVIRQNTSEHEVQVMVSDNGLGIPEADLPHVVKRAYRVWRGRPSAVGGAGLGLPIAKWIAEAHHGDISITSTLHQGTTVTVRLPLHPVPSPQCTHEPDHASRTPERV
ncbi:PAS domain S-box protein [Nitrospira sp. BLG_1]|uniref:PAS domain S-box protein n=1 Tax=Nitrospira sp. BLG_1 TaxID=3395883 RepID=UPI0039BC2354